MDDVRDQLRGPVQRFPGKEGAGEPRETECGEDLAHRREKKKGEREG